MLIVQTKDTMSDIYLDAVRIRNQVFVKEQGVPIEIEIDKNEAYAIHFVLYDDEEKRHPLATVRLLPLNDQTMKLQRMAVLSQFRGQGLGETIIQAAESFAHDQGFKKITLGAQLSAADFYQKLGYQKEGETFKDAGIDHITMTKAI